MDCAPNVNIFRELQTVHDTGYFSGHVSPEEDWQQVRKEARKEGIKRKEGWVVIFTLRTRIKSCSSLLSDKNELYSRFCKLF